MITVAQLIEFLKTQPQDALVAYSKYSEAVLMKLDEVGMAEAGEPRSDGWLHNVRKDKPTRQYLFFPGN